MGFMLGSSCNKCCRCDVEASSGGFQIFDRTYTFPAGQRTLRFCGEAFTIKDRFIVYLITGEEDGETEEVIFDSGPGGQSGKSCVCFEKPEGARVRVFVDGLVGGTGTAWNFTIQCDGCCSEDEDCRCVAVTGEKEQLISRPPCSGSAPLVVTINGSVGDDGGLLLVDGSAVSIPASFPLPLGVNSFTVSARDSEGEDVAYDLRACFEPQDNCDLLGYECCCDKKDSEAPQNIPTGEGGQSIRKGVCGRCPRWYCYLRSITIPGDVSCEDIDLCDPPPFPPGTARPSCCITQCVQKVCLRDDDERLLPGGIYSCFTPAAGPFACESQCSCDGVNVSPISRCWGGGPGAGCFPTGSEFDDGCFCDSLCYTTCGDCCNPDAGPNGCCTNWLELASLEDPEFHHHEKIRGDVVGGFCNNNADLSEEIIVSSLRKVARLHDDGYWYITPGMRVPFLLCLQDILSGSNPGLRISELSDEIQEFAIAYRTGLHQELHGNSNGEDIF
jgi:hypothetical protein